jgi:hypothetical protein
VKIYYHRGIESSKYSKAMPSIILKQYSLPEANKEISINDSPNPLSFLEWTNLNYGIAGNNSEQQYQKYLLDWYSTKENSKNIKSLKDDYKELLKKLSIVFRNDENFTRITSLDLDDDLQLKLAIPYYVKKLKEIALYYRDKRESVKRAKLRYNMVGSFNAVERTFYEHILKAFSKRDYVLNVPSQSAWNAFPDLSAINKGFSIEVEELYDDTDYYDITEDGTYSYGVSSTNPLVFLLDEYINSTFGVDTITEIPLSALQIPIQQDPEFGQFSLNIENIYTANVKYTSSDKFLVDGGYFVDDIHQIDLTFKGGNNFFYWFSGEHYVESPHANYNPININDLPWIESGAIAASAYSDSDVIFVNYNGDIQGAWLSERNSIPVSGTMGVNLINSKEFKFPYPGIGVSAEGIGWTGKEISEFDKYSKSFFPNQSTKNKTIAELTKKYWSTTDSISTVVPVFLNDTNLVESGAFASKKFHLADKVITRPFTSDAVHDDDPDAIFSGTQNVEWLYDFTNTQLPILNGENKIQWPLQRYENISDIKINYTHGEDVLLNEIPIDSFYGGVAGDDLDSSDVIFKLDSKFGVPIEAAWLNGSSLTIFNSCTGSSIGEEVELPSRTNTLKPAFTPYSVPTLKHWWYAGTAKYNRIDNRKNRPNAPGPKKLWIQAFTRWTDIISKAEFLKDDNRSRPTVNPGQGLIEFNESILNVNFNNFNINSYDVEDSIVWNNVGKVTRSPFTIAIAFQHRVGGAIRANTLLETYVNNDSDKIKIVIKGNKLFVKSGNSRINNPVTITHGLWHYCIVVVNGSNSKVIVDGVEALGRLAENPLKKVRIGQNKYDNNQFVGRIRDIIVFSSALNIDDQVGLKQYMQGLTFTKIYRPPISPSQIKDALANNQEIISPIEVSDVAGRFVSGSIQPGISLVAPAKEHSRFIWTGSGTINDSGNLNNTKNVAFRGHKHDAACPYNKIKRRTPISGKVEENTQWKSCDCGAIQHSPLGHIGESYRDNADIGDYIILDTGYPKFTSLTDWTGSDGLPWDSSEDFGWFKLDEDQVDGKTGWGTGQWITNYGDPLILKPGKIYLYYRSGFNTASVVRGEPTAPEYILNHVNCDCSYINCDCVETSCGVKWKRAELIDGVWVGRDEESNLKFESGNYYSYLHRDKRKFSIYTSDSEIYEDCTNSSNFILNVPIEGTKPYWAEGSFEYGPQTKNKGVMYSGDRLELVGGYLPITQPIPSSLKLTNDLFFRYERNAECSTDCFVWEQPLVFDVAVTETGWKKLEIDQCVKSDVLNSIQNVGCSKCKELEKKCSSCCEAEKLCGCIIDSCITTRTGVSATDIDSDILLMTKFETEPVMVNYHAKGTFVLPLSVCDTTMGMAPSGGRWIEESFTPFTESRYPWRNIPNVYNPMVAYVESDNLYGISDCGFFTPSRLGYTNLILKNKIIELDRTIVRAMSSDSIILDTDHYISGPYTVSYTDSTWMKHKSNCIAGSILNPIDYQQFSPYQTSYENIKRNEYGIQRQGDIISPWGGINADQFVDVDNYKATINGNIPIYCGPDSWVNSQPQISGNLSVWKTDVYGNNYGLYKVGDFSTINTRLSTGGSMWIRNTVGDILRLNDAFESIVNTYSHIPTLVSDLTGNGIVNFDIFYDTLIIQTQDFVIIEKISMNYDTGSVYSVADYSYSIEVDYSDFGGYWADESTKTITFGYLSGGVPIIKQLELESYDMNTLLDENSDTSEWDVVLASHDAPKFTHNFNNNTYNMSFLALSGSDSVLIVSNYKFGEGEDILYTDEVKVVTIPESTNKNIIKTSAFDNSLLIVFEDSINNLYQILIDN